MIFDVMYFVRLVKLQTPTIKIIALLIDEVDNTSNVSIRLSQPKDICRRLLERKSYHLYQYTPHS